MADEQDDGGFEAVTGINWGPGIAQTLLIITFVFGPLFASCSNSNVPDLAGPKTQAAAPQANSGFQGQAPQVAESPSPTPADVPTPVQDQPTPDTGTGVNPGGTVPTPGGGGTGGTGACTPSAPNNISASAGTVSGSSNGNGGSWTVTGLGSATSVTLSVGGMVSCGLHHTLRASDAAHPANFTCNPSTGASVSGTVTLYMKGDSVNASITYDQGCP